VKRVFYCSAVVAESNVMQQHRFNTSPSSPLELLMGVKDEINGWFILEIRLECSEIKKNTGQNLVALSL
jgi:hypothetical protein